MLRRASVSALLLAALLAGCGADDPVVSERTPAATSERTPEATPEPTPEKKKEKSSKPRSGTRIKTGDSQFGPVLFDGDGQAIYYFDLEKTSRPRCFGDCADAWPPVYANGRPQAGPGIEQGLLGTTKRRGDRRQVTYDGRPLYYYAHEGADEVRCHNVPGFGGLWLAVQPDGKPVPIS